MIDTGGREKRKKSQKSKSQTHHLRDDLKGGDHLGDYLGDYLDCDLDYDLM